MRLDQSFMIPEGELERSSSSREVILIRVLKIIQHVQTIINSVKREQAQQK